MTPYFFENLTIGSTLMLAYNTLINPRKVNIAANHWLAALLFVATLVFLGGSKMMIEVYRQYPQLIGFDNFFLFTIAPLFYMVVVYFVSPDRKFKKLDLLHFTPFLLFLPIAILLFLMDPKTKLGLVENETTELNSDDTIGMLIVLLLILMGFTYMFFAFRKIKKHQKNIKLFASSVETINLDWLKYLLLIFGAVLLLWLNEVVFKPDNFKHLSSIGYLLCIYVMAYFTSQQVEIFPYSTTEVDGIQEIIQENEQAAQKVDFVKQKRFSDTQMDIYKTQLLHFLEVEKVFIDDTLNLPKLATKMSLSVNDLSYLINEGFGANFFQLINKYRVEEAKKLLLSPKYDHLNILGLAFESGFGSKSTFNSTFKKMTGLSPSEFQKSAKENLN